MVSVPPLDVLLFDAALLPLEMAVPLSSSLLGSVRFSCADLGIDEFVEESVGAKTFIIPIDCIMGIINNACSRNRKRRTILLNVVVEYYFSGKLLVFSYRFDIYMFVAPPKLGSLFVMDCFCIRCKATDFDQMRSSTTCHIISVALF